MSPRIQDASTFRVGSVTPSALYVGTTKVWPKAAAIRSSSKGANTGSSTLPIAVPTGAVTGDLLLVAINVRNGVTSAPAATSGWTVVSQRRRVTTGYLLIYYRFLVAGDPSSFTFTVDNTTSSTCVGTMLAISGVDTATPIDGSVSQSNASGTQPAGPALTPTVARTLNLHFLIGAAGTTTIQTSTIAPPPVQYQSDGFSGSSSSSFVSTAQEPGQGAGVVVPGAAWVMSAASTSATAQVAIRSA